MKTKEVKITSLRDAFSKWSRFVKAGKGKIAATYYGDVVAYLVPISEIEGIELQRKEITTADFRNKMTDCWHELEADGGCYVLTYHKKPKAAFMSATTAEMVGVAPINKEYATEVFSMLDGEVKKLQAKGLVGHKPEDVAKAQAEILLCLREVLSERLEATAA